MGDGTHAEVICVHTAPSEVLACIPCDDISSRFSDVSGNGCDLLPDRLNTAAFATEGQARSAVGAANFAAGLVIPAEKLSVNFSKNYLIFSIDLFSAPPAADGHLLSFSSVVGGGAGYTGFYLDWKTNGTVQVVFTFDGALKNNALTLPTNPALPFFEATPKWRRLQIVVDPDGSVFVFRDRRLAGAYPNVFVGATAFPDQASGKRTRLGGWADDAAPTVACDFRNIHIISGPGHLPVSLGSIFRRIMQSPRDIVPQSVIRKAIHRSWWFGIAQSNFAGPNGGASWRGSNDGDGCPMTEPCLTGAGPTNVSGSTTSHPFLAGMLGKRGAWWGVDNTGIGSTSLAVTWVGVGRSYVSGMKVSRGGYVYDGGRVYRLGGSAAYGVSYTVNTPPSAGTPPAGTSWEDTGQITAQEVEGYIYSPLDGTGRFDPNNLIRTAAARIITYRGMDAKGAIVEIGQGDASFGTTRVQFASAIQSVIDYLTPLGLYTMVSMPITCKSSNPWYVSNLLPGRLDALAKNAGNSLVIPGPDLASALGILPTESAVQTPAGTGVAFEPRPALQNDGSGDTTSVHANAAAQIKVAEQYALSYCAAFKIP